ncbi:MAG: hypothetical protein JWP44_4464, partial [Mucilaginibacter sp.]|nr:hypothetical protein [Mucilaginibacter sp.]
MTENDIIEAARERLGNTVDRSVDEQSVPSQAISAELRSYLVEISKAFGSGSSRKDFNFFSVPGQQDYPIVTTIGNDVRDIQEVLRSDAYVSESFLEPTMVDPRTGVPVARASFIDQAYQQDALDVIVAQQRFRRQDMYDWEVVNSNGTLYLRLMPPPTDVSTISVRYVATSESVDSLPEEAREAAENAACV